MTDVVGAYDSNTRRVLESILSLEKDHAEELADLLKPAR